MLKAISPSNVGRGHSMDSGLRRNDSVGGLSLEGNTGFQGEDGERARYSEPRSNNDVIPAKAGTSVCGAGENKQRFPLSRE